MVRSLLLDMHIANIFSYSVACILLLMESLLSNSFYFFKDFIYLFMRDTEREAETQAEGEKRTAPYGTRSWDPRITP